MLLGAVYAFLALTPEIRVRLRDLADLAGADGARDRAIPARSIARRQSRAPAGNYLAWQLFRRPEPRLDLLSREVPRRSGSLVWRAAAVGLWLLRRDGLLARDAAPLLDRGSGGLLRALAGQGLPVPAADRAAVAVLAGSRPPRGCRALSRRRLRACRAPARRIAVAALSSLAIAELGPHRAVALRRASWRAPAACPAGGRRAAGSRRTSRGARRS